MARSSREKEAEGRAEDAVNAQAGKWAEAVVGLWFAVAGAYTRLGAGLGRWNRPWRRIKEFGLYPVDSDSPSRVFRGMAWCPCNSGHPRAHDNRTSLSPRPLPESSVHGTSGF